MLPLLIVKLVRFIDETIVQICRMGAFHAISARLPAG
jgi:hypothetical protein